MVFSRTIENVDATPKVDKIEVVDAKTLNVTLSDGTKETVTLEKALEPNKETEVTFKIKDVEYKAKVTYVVTTATAVKSVSATNLKEVVVEFDGTVDKETAEEASNYSLKSGKAVKSVKLSDDKKTATVTVVGTLTNNKADAISISNVKAGDKVIDVKNVEFTAVDNKLPEVTTVKSLGTKSLKLEFSEPVTELKQSNFTLDGKAYFGKVTLGANDRSVILTPYGSVLTVGEHKLTVSGVKDYAGFVSLSSTHDFTVVEDKEAPTVTEATATLESVTLTFSEDVDAETIKASNVYWKSGDSKKEAYEFEAIADNKYKFFFKEDKTLPTGKVDIHVEGVKDFSDNQIAKDTKVTVTPEIDQTRPEVRKVSVTDARTIKVTFSKALDSKSVQEVKNYTVLNKDGKVVSVQTANLDPNDSKTVIINLYSDLSTGENKLTIKNIKDATKLQNTMLDYSEKIVKGDKDAPEFDSKVVNTKDRRVVLTFNKKMNVDTLVDYSNYLVKIDGKLQTLSSNLADISVMQNGTSVVITFAETLDGKTIDFTGGGTNKAHVSQLQVLGVKDAAGNLLKEFANPTNTANNLVDLSTSTTLSLAASAEAFSYKVNNVEQVKDVQVDGTSTVTLKFKDDVLGTSAANLNLIVDFTKLQTNAGNTAPTGTATASITVNDTTTNLLDSVKPEITDKGVYGVDGNKITINYSEALKIDEIAAGNQDLIDADFLITRVSDNKELNVGQYDVTVNGNKLVITLSDARTVETYYKVTVKDSAKYVIDKSPAKNVLTKSTGDSALVKPGTTSLTGVALNDVTGAGNNGKSVFILPTPSVVGNTYKYFVSTDNNAVPAPLVGADLSAWTTVVNGTEITVDNGKNVGVAEVDAAGKAVKFVNVVAQNSDYVAATNGKAVGTVTIATDAVLEAITTAQDTKTLAITVDGGAAKNLTIDKTVVTKDAFLVALNGVLGTTAAATFTAAGELQVVSATTGTASTVAFSGDAATAFVGTAVATPGTDAKN